MFCRDSVTNRVFVLLFGFHFGLFPACALPAVRTSASLSLFYFAPGARELNVPRSVSAQSKAHVSVCLTVDFRIDFSARAFDCSGRTAFFSTWTVS